jgi:hypothetical protein
LNADLDSRIMLDKKYKKKEIKMKIKILFITVIFLFIGRSNIVQSQETQNSKEKELTIHDIMTLKQYHVDGAITVKYTDVSEEAVRQQIDENVEEAARQFGFVGKAFNCGALDDLSKLYGNNGNRLNLEEVMSLKRVDVYRAVLLNIYKNMSVDSINELEENEVITMGVQALGEELSTVIGERDPCGINQYRTNVQLGESPHIQINNTCTVFKLLLEELHNEHVNVRIEAIRSIGKLEHTSIVEPLINILSDESINMRNETVETLKKVTGEDLGMDSTDWLNWWATRCQ